MMMEESLRNDSPTFPDKGVFKQMMEQVSVVPMNFSAQVQIKDVGHTTFEWSEYHPLHLKAIYMPWPGRLRASQHAQSRMCQLSVTHKAVVMAGGSLLGHALGWVPRRYHGTS